MTLDEKLKVIEGYDSRSVRADQVKGLLAALRKCREQRDWYSSLCCTANHHEDCPEEIHVMDNDAELLALLQGGGE